MSGALLGAIAGLAALDAFNPATIVAVTLILLAAPSRPGLTALVTVLGAATTVFLAGAALFLGASAAAGAVGGILLALRYVAFGAAGAAVVIAGVRRFRTRPRKPIELPAWFTPWTAFPFGALLTAADLPNAFPYFIAIERMLAAGLTTSTAVAVLAAYAFVYCLPCLVLLVLGLRRGGSTTGWLQRMHDLFGTDAVIAPSRTRAAAYAAAALAVAAIAVRV